MHNEETSRFPGGLRRSDDAAIEESGLLGTHRRWTNISRYEIIFLILGILAAIATDTLTIIRLAQIDDKTNPDFAYCILILVNSVFLLLFLITGIFQQRITDIVTFFINAVMVTIYVIVHFVARNAKPDSQDKDSTIRLIRLIFTIIFNICFVPLAILVIRDYRRDEFSKRLFGAFPAARRPLKIYNIFDCLARINTVLSISAFILNLYNFNALESTDQIFLYIGIPLAFLWLGLGVGMIRLENYILVVIFYVISCVQPAFLGYALYSAVEYSPPSLTTTTTPITITYSTSLLTTEMTTSSTEISNVTFSTMTMTTANTTAPPRILVSVPDALYVSIGANLLTHVLSMIFAFLCVRNFGKGLKERVFNNRFDKFFQRR